MTYLLPTSFNWPLFAAALGLMAAPLLVIGAAWTQARSNTKTV
jgi:hypothetical protein